MYFETTVDLPGIPEGTTVAFHTITKEQITLSTYVVVNERYVVEQVTLPFVYYAQENYRGLDKDEPAFRDLFKDIKPKDFVRDEEGDVYYVYGISPRVTDIPHFEAHGLDVVNARWCKAEYISPAGCKKILRTSLDEEEKIAADLATFFGLPD